jgi:hypothetical protein
MAEGEDVEILLYDEEPEILPEDPERMEGTVRDSSNFGSQS